MKKGFTLIELIVVIAIILILGSVVLVNLKNGRGDCEDFKDRTISSVPARCLRSFGIDTISN